MLISIKKWSSKTISWDTIKWNFLLPGLVIRTTHKSKVWEPVQTKLRLSLPLPSPHHSSKIIERYERSFCLFQIELKFIKESNILCCSLSLSNVKTNLPSCKSPMCIFLKKQNEHVHKVHLSIFISVLDRRIRIRRITEFKETAVEKSMEVCRGYC